MKNIQLKKNSLKCQFLTPPTIRNPLMNFFPCLTTHCFFYCDINSLHERDKNLAGNSLYGSMSWRWEKGDKVQVELVVGAGEWRGVGGERGCSGTPGGRNSSRLATPSSPTIGLKTPFLWPRINMCVYVSVYKRKGWRTGAGLEILGKERSAPRELIFKSPLF